MKNRAVAIVEAEALVGHALGQRDVAEARLELALDALGELVRYVRRVGGYMEPEHQLMMRRCEALLVESGRSVEA